MVKSLKKGFTLAEVLTTLMVIGVVAAMTIPTLINNTGKQQDKVAAKKAMSVLSQAAQLLHADDASCPITSGSEAASLASCFKKVMNGTLTASNSLQTSDGMVYYFFAPTGAATDWTDACGSLFTDNTTDGWKGAGACAVIVDTNGTEKGASSQPTATTFASSTGLSALPTDKDQVAFALNSNGVRPCVDLGDIPNTGHGYEFIYGTKATTSLTNETKICYTTGCQKSGDSCNCETKSVSKYASCGDAKQWTEGTPPCTKPAG